ncbi:efflux RND transporter periplasmic adaptor subunit [Duganella sp. LX20W]|uniref:Efflux RND transporter periplasmic adaptor subunit n=1 Tax=Rugamonas brunnea TaxID=2758569 RepID=A0A7W2ETF1_9BURK|nr:efflux RND transporter periplasmic adaptor subunit [Rugamonas brunnea]MBA5638267.1 efflux RND transporter periplasmic adaptor subunit [Rugamonas brunnea]
MTMRRILTILLATCSLAGLLVWSLAPRPVTVQVASIARGPFEQTVDEDGKTRVRERYLVSAPLAGRIARSGYKAGDTVAAGQPLAVLTPLAPVLLDARTQQQLAERVGAAEAARARAQAGMARAQAALRKSESDLARVQKLAKDGFLSPAQSEQADLDLQLARRELDATRQAVHVADHDLATARAALQLSRSGTPGETWTVRAPVGGTVLKVLQESEASVPLGTPLVELGNPADIEIVADVLSADAVQIQPGYAVRIERWGGPNVLRGQVRRVEPSAYMKISALGVEEQRVNLIIDIVSPPEEARGLRDGFRVEVRVVVHREADVLRVPVGAVFRQGEDWATYVIDGDRARLRTVRLGPRNQREAVVLQGLKAGEVVVLYPPDTLADGLRVRTSEPARSTN